MIAIDEILTRAGDTLAANRVFGEPYERNGVTVITAASVRGGMGGGEGESEGEEERPSGVGGGFGMTARPVGAYLIKGDQVSWIPAADVTRMILASQVVLIFGLVALRSILRARRKHH